MQKLNFTILGVEVKIYNTKCCLCRIGWTEIILKDLKPGIHITSADPQLRDKFLP